MESTKLEEYLTYRDSGVKWLNEIPLHWKLVRLKYIVSYQKGKNPKEISLEETGDIYLSMEYLRGDYKKIQYINNSKGLVSVEENDILLLWDGSNAGEFIRGKKGILSSTMAVIKINSIHERYSKYYLNVIEKQLRQSTIGMGIPHVNSEELKNLIFLVPPYKEQISIAQFLDSKIHKIDKAINQKTRLIELLKERKQILIHKAVTHGLDPTLPMKDSGVEWIGMIPKHWKIVTNYSLFEQRNEKGNDKLPILSISIHTAVSSEELNDENNIRGKIRIEDKSSYKLVKPNDIAFNMMRAWQGAIGSVSTMGMVSPAYIVVKPITTINSIFFEYQYRTDLFIQQMDRFSRGITDFRKRLYWNEFKRLFTILPPENEQREIVEFVENATAKIQIAVAYKQKEIEKLKEYKSTLINSAVTGKIKVS
ncbi:restriction endonuclease subunit S [Chitinophaga sp. CC14]